MTGLLISVRSAAEAELALAGGADLIDVKEPSHGSLGAADPATWREIQAVVAGQKPTSAALGELVDDNIERLARQATGFRYAKIGLAGGALRSDWRKRWDKVTGQLPVGVGAVPVAYADWHAAAAPNPEAVLELAAGSSARLLLIDTFDKRGGALLDCWPLEGLTRFAQAARQCGVDLVVAGSLNEESIGRLLALWPAWVGVRGAVCDGSRVAAIDLARVKSLANWIHERTVMHALANA